MNVNRIFTLLFVGSKASNGRKEGESQFSIKAWLVWGNKTSLVSLY